MNLWVKLDQFKNFKDIQLKVVYNIEIEEEVLIQEKGNYCSKFQKRKVKD